MSERRPAIPKALRDHVLSEFNHRCAICGEDRPQVHHINEDPRDNRPENLLPLCPNHHLSDQHDPTRQVDPELLALFRSHKDPQMLSPQFQPVFKRLKPLLHPSDEVEYDQLASFAADLIAFVRRLSMGDYYVQRLQALLDWSGPAGYMMTDRERVYAAQTKLYKGRLAHNLPEVIALLVEQLRYQDWPRYEA